MGDPAGIGPEVTVKALARLRRRGVILIGSRDVLEREADRQGVDVLARATVVDPFGRLGQYQVGKTGKRCGSAAWAYLEHGAGLLRRGEIGALVTAPVSKAALRLAGFRWPGQTEFLAHRLGARRYAMLAWTPAYRAVLVTTHLPLARVARHITPESVAEKTVLLDRFLRREGLSNPRIAVMALNPHGDEFSLGEEDRIRLGVRLSRRQGVNASGPWPADTVAGRGGYDGFVAMYHDQAMVRAKLSGVGVNVTLGLGAVRTAPLHGVAFDIAGRGRASAASMTAAVRLAGRLAARPS